MPLIKNGSAVQDPWIAVSGEEELDRSGPLLVTLAIWQTHRDRLMARNGPIGIRLASAESPALIAEDLDRFDLVALEFPKFTDGRAYSYARLLRERQGFTGEVRAVGNVLRDQIPFMLRCGFDALEVDDRGAEAWREAVSAFSAWYQPAADGEAPIAARRRHAAAARATVPTVRSEPLPRPAPSRPAPSRREPSPAELAVVAATWAY